MPEGLDGSPQQPEHEPPLFVQLALEQLELQIRRIVSHGRNCGCGLPARGSQRGDGIVKKW
jgi:hypothetical protein